MKYSPDVNSHGNPIPSFLQHDSFLEFITSENVLRIMIGFMIGNVLSRFANKLDIYGKLISGKWSWKEFFEVVLQFMIGFYTIYIIYRVLIGFRGFSLKHAYEEHAKKIVSKVKG